MMEVMGQPRQRFLTATDKCRKSLVGTTELIFCSDYKVLAERGALFMGVVRL
jgi:hypothetical protein